MNAGILNLKLVSLYSGIWIIIYNYILFTSLGTRAATVTKLYIQLYNIYCLLAWEPGLPRLLNVTKVYPFNLESENQVKHISVALPISPIKI